MLLMHFSTFSFSNTSAGAHIMCPQAVLKQSVFYFLLTHVTGTSIPPFNCRKTAFYEVAMAIEKHSQVISEQEMVLYL